MFFYHWSDVKEVLSGLIKIFLGILFLTLLVMLIINLFNKNYVDTKTDDIGKEAVISD